MPFGLNELNPFLKAMGPTQSYGKVVPQTFDKSIPPKGKPQMPMSLGPGNTGGTKKPAGSVFPGYGMTPSQLAAALGIPPQTSKGTYVPASTPSSSANYVPSAGGMPSGNVSPYQVNGTGGTGNVGTFAPASTGSSYTATPNVQSGGTGGQGSAVGLPTTNATDPVNWQFQGSDTSWSPRDLETMLNDPYDFQNEFLKSRGMGTPNANAALGQYASRMNPLAFLIAGANQDPNKQGDLENIAKVYEGLMSNYITPGGRTPDVQEVIKTLLGVGNIGSGDAANSLLQSVLAGQDPQGQVQAVNQILGASLAGAPGLFGTGWANMLDQTGQQYMSSTKDAYGGPNATYLDALRNSPFWQAAGR